MKTFRLTGPGYALDLLADYTEGDLVVQVGHHDRGVRSAHLSRQQVALLREFLKVFDSPEDTETK